MLIPRRWVGVLAVAAVLGLCDTASAQGRPGARGMLMNTSGASQSRGACTMGTTGTSTTGTTSTASLTAARQAYIQQLSAMQTQSALSQYQQQQLAAYLANQQALAQQQAYIQSLRQQQAGR